MKFFNLEMSDMVADNIAIVDDGGINPQTTLCEVIVTPVYKIAQKGKKMVAVHSSGEVLRSDF